MVSIVIYFVGRLFEKKFDKIDGAFNVIYDNAHKTYLQSTDTAELQTVLQKLIDSRGLVINSRSKKKFNTLFDQLNTKVNVLSRGMMSHEITPLWDDFVAKKRQVDDKFTPTVTDFRMFLLNDFTVIKKKKYGKNSCW